MPYSPETTHIRPVPKRVVVLVRAEQHPEVVKYLEESKTHFTNYQHYYAKGAHPTLAAFQEATSGLYARALAAKSRYVEHTYNDIKCFVFERHDALALAEGLYDAGVRRWHKTFFPEHVAHGEAMSAIYYGNKSNRFVWETTPTDGDTETGGAAAGGVTLKPLPGVEPLPQVSSED